MAVEMIQDVVALKVHEAYKSVGKSGKPTEGEWTCLAGFVEESDGGFKAVSMATGTKCVGGGSMVFDGSVVHDSHAEVLSRRAFLLYLYEQIRLAAESSNSIFEKKQNQYALKSGVKFHFYASQVPCGDASIIPMNDIQHAIKRKATSLDGPPNKKSMADIHRTGAKPVKSDPRQDPKTDGTGYHVRGAVRIKPGRGDPTKSLSCSDKISKWLFCGLQGALLSLLVPEPLELSSIVIGGAGPYDADVLADALFHRSGLTRKPHLMRSSLTFDYSAEATKAVRPCGASIWWADVSGKKSEASVDGRRLGATKSGKGKSRLLVSKMEFFLRFEELIPDDTYEGMTYGAVKLLSTEYQTRKTLFLSAMGSWSDDKSAYDNFSVGTAKGSGC